MKLITRYTLWSLVIGKAAADCFFDCERSGGWTHVCQDTTGCETCPFDETCEKLCNRCSNEENVAFGGLACDCEAIPTDAPVIDCFNDCYLEEEATWLCDFEFGCTSCPDATEEELCGRLCSRCAGETGNTYAGLDCVCPGDATASPVETPTASPQSTPTTSPIGTPTASPIDMTPDFPTLSPVEPSGPCFGACNTLDETASWICKKDNGCQGCSVESSCSSLCGLCADYPGSMYGGLGCDCFDGVPTASPVEPAGPCFGACNQLGDEFEWICGKDNGCQGCPKEDTCENLCSLCADKPGSTYGALDCDCFDGVPTASPVEPAGPCFAACNGVGTEFEWICGKDNGCQGCPQEGTCENLCSLCADIPDSTYGALGCDCSEDDPTTSPVETPTKDPTSSPVAFPTASPVAPPTAAPIIVPTTAPAVPAGPCFNTCESDDLSKKWICGQATGCQGCPLIPTCDKLCARCSNIEASTYGGLGCDCPDQPTAAPSEPVCFGACSKDSEATWVCNYDNFGCKGCDDPADICTKLCSRCQLETGENVIAGLTCDCP